MNRHILRTLLVAVTVGAGTAQAAVVWDNGATTLNWKDAANWNPDGVPAANSIIQFNGSGVGSAQVPASSTVTMAGDTTAYNFGNTTEIDLNNGAGFTLDVGAKSGFIYFKTFKVQDAFDYKVLAASTGFMTISNTQGMPVDVVSGGSLTIDGWLTVNAFGAATLTKTGTGNLILKGPASAPNTSTVSVIANGGTLTIDTKVNYKGTTTINSTATLAGSGDVLGAVTIANGGKLAPGNSAGVLTLASTLNISGALANAAPSMLFELGSSSDKVVLTSGVLTIGSGLMNFDDFTFTPIAGFGAGVYTLFDTAQTLSGSLGSSLTGSIGGGYQGTISLANANQDVILTVVAIVPAPAALPAGLSLLTLSCLRRRGVRR
ncbi:MAG: hypothetical protein GC162_02025 [Planctomycetes bacterium]|nr:hypothetical protein [Planctomycetota bacterium]